jgi:hypothetical protein
LVSISSFGTAILRSEFTDGNMWFPAFMKSQPKDMIKISWSLQITRSTLKYLKHTSNSIFGTGKQRGMHTFKLLNFAQYQFLQNTKCWSTIIGSLFSLPKVKLQDFNICTNYARQLFFIPNLLLYCSWYH